MSREMLYHATWLKYHGTTVGPTSEKVADGDIKNLLQGAINGAEAVMNSGIYSIGNTYNALFTTEIWLTIRKSSGIVNIQAVCSVML